MELKDLVFIGSSRNDLREFPQHEIDLIRQRLSTTEEEYRGDI